jgi:hypothetical protein
MADFWKGWPPAHRRRARIRRPTDWVYLDWYVPPFTNPSVRKRWEDLRGDSIVFGQQFQLECTIFFRFSRAPRVRPCVALRYANY